MRVGMAWLMDWDGWLLKGSLLGFIGLSEKASSGLIKGRLNVQAVIVEEGVSKSPEELQINSRTLSLPLPRPHSLPLITTENRQLC